MLNTLTCMKFWSSSQNNILSHSVTSNLHTPKVLRNVPLMAGWSNDKLPNVSYVAQSLNKVSNQVPSDCEESRYQLYSDVWYNPVLVVFHCHSCHSKLHSLSRRYKIVNEHKKQHVTVTELVNRKEFVRSSNISCCVQLHFHSTGRKGTKV